MRTACRQLSSRCPDMEREEHSLRRKYEDLRLTLDTRTRELAQSQELYAKLKQRVLLSQAQDIGPGLSRTQTPIQRAGALDTSHGHAPSQLPRPVMSMGTRGGGVSTYFPDSPGYSKNKSGTATLVGWNKPAPSQRKGSPLFGSGSNLLIGQRQVYPVHHPTICLSGIMAH